MEKETKSQIIRFIFAAIWAVFWGVAGAILWEVNLNTIGLLKWIVGGSIFVIGFIGYIKIIGD